MSLLSDQISGYVERSSWIRRMFEAGIELKAQYGADNVYDFSLGNPDLPPPAAVSEVLADLSKDAQKPFAFGYMPNFGYPFAREALARRVSREQSHEVAPEDLIITCGAAGALNVFFRTVLNPGDEVLCPAPYFVEYGFYAENHNGKLVSVPSKPLTFELDLDALGAAITAKTRVVLINSPNNPSGVVYTRDELVQLAALLTAKSEEFGRPIFLLADEPYRFLAFDGVEVPSILPLYPYSLVASSFSKNLALAGERVGYAVLNPAMPGKEELMGGLVLSNRILGFVNAPAIGQVLAARAAEEQVDASIYDERRKAMAKVLDDAGYEYSMPGGAFYFFPRVPDVPGMEPGDDVAFCARLQEQRILAVPGRGFGTPGYFRLTFCIDTTVIQNSAQSFKDALK